ncbi:ABC transporter ATP-binding protein [Alkaliphilus peptidifermentans]|uniref:Carbohydrate ABC transporter ATP-binding protein, CUT1 family n=1 Tax=Alkaliphilus peptidifermentans DSM 18978 TaxID=1120976 RepID=A0A1G5HF91_9FIRM|nr:phosphate ABC transporter ATP-binding protein [Alkaliphilus peptidifermentans]SCY61980.1 carbohydrate ABC transporter ATP-binding protein, CUT1 family [Alkaliphilus peptidifermentans DSM 18978]
MKIKVSGLTKVYNNKQVLNIPKLEIEKGSLLGIIGPNGAGKSTLVKIIGGIETSTSGLVLFDGKPINSNLYQNMTMVFQKPYLLRGSVFYNIAYPLRIRKVEEEEISRRVEKILDEMDLVEIRNQKSWTLSGGEAQKVALARAIIFNPSLLILDEPTANIDPSSIAIMEKIIKKSNQENGTTVIIVTHNLQQANRICKDVGFMYRGELIEIGSKEKVIRNPENVLTRDFIKGEILI